MKIIREELVDKTYEVLKEMITNNSLKAGEKIIQDKVAEELGVSRTTLRTALQKLEAEFLIESHPRKGMVVKTFTRKEIVEIFDCRIALESLAVRLFCENASESDIQQLKKIFGPFKDKPAESIKIQEYQKADILFHEMLVDKCGNGYLRKIFQQGNMVSCINLIGLIRPLTETMPEHLAIISAITSRDTDRAVRLMKEHLEISRHLVNNNIETSKPD